jgi:hypothetical protein
MAAKFSENTLYSNKGFSSYNELLTTLQKNFSHGLQFDVNYTWSHSIDNVSLIANSSAAAGYGFVCDVQRPRICRGNPGFDVTHYVSADFTYSLPFGRGRTFATNAKIWLNEVIGGWDLSGISQWHTGGAFGTVSNAFVAGYSGSVHSPWLELNWNHESAMAGYIANGLWGCNRTKLCSAVASNLRIAELTGCISEHVDSR